MSSMKNSVGLLLLISLLHTGVRCGKETLFVYSTRGGEALLPCASVSPNCSSIKWTFFKGGRVQYAVEVDQGEVRADSDRASRMNVTSNCDLLLRDLVVGDAGSYGCEAGKQRIAGVYLSLLDVSSLSTITELHPGGNLVLSCILHSYYDAGNCALFSSRRFVLQWLAEDGTPLADDRRYELVEGSPCNLTLIIKLQTEDNNRRWRCQVNATANSRPAFLDFKSSFLLLNTPGAEDVETSGNERCPVQLPVSRIVLCVVLPLLVSFVGVFTWTLDHKRAKMSAAAFELQ